MRMLCLKDKVQTSRSLAAIEAAISEELQSSPGK
jgi:hypothetical protein